MWHCLATVEPLDPISGERQPLHASSADLASICALDGKVWEPAIATPPQLAIRLFNGDLETSIEPGAARLPLAMGVLKETYPGADTYDWSGAPISIYAGKAGEAWPWRRVFRGNVREFGREGQLLTLRGEVDTAPFAADLLTAYEGTGGAAGGPDLKGKLKPLIFGHAMNVEPVLLDAIDNVYQFSGYGPIEAVSALFERGSNFGPAAADYADFAALVAATIEPGDWATCLAEGLVRLGAPAHGVITGDVRGHTVGATTPRLTGAIISAAAQMAGVDPALIDAGTLYALDADKPFPANIVISEQTKFIDLARRLARPCNHQAGVSLTGLFFVTKVDFAPAAVLALDGQGASLPEVKEVTEGTTSPPYAKFTLGANRCWRVQTPDEIAFQAEIVDRGLYEASATYREGNIVTSPDRSRWIYTNATPSSGNAPPAWPVTSNPYWANIEPPPTAGDLTYEDGTPIEALKPAEPGATEGAPPGTPVGDRPAEQVTSELDQHTAQIAAAESSIVQAQGDIQSLFDTYGDTASAAQSAADALASENAAEAAEQLASQHEANAALAEQNALDAKAAAQAAEAGATDQAGIATAERQLAETARAGAEGFRDEAFTAKEGAEDASATATQQAGISAGAALEGKSYALAKGLTPNADYSNGLSRWFSGHGTGEGVVGGAGSWLPGPFDGRSGLIKTALGQRAWVYGDLIPIDTTRKYIVRGGIRHSAPDIVSRIELAWYDAAGIYIDRSGFNFTGITGWHDLNGPIIAADGSGDGMFPAGTRFARPRIDLNQTVLAGREAYGDYCYIEDISESKRAEGYAVASAGNATTATAKATEAEQFAQAADSDRLAAETARSETEALRNETVTARDDAAGSAASAALSEGAAAESETNSADSATAAAASEAIASTKADEATGAAATATQQTGLAVAAKNDAEAAATASEASAASADADAASAASSEALAATYRSSALARAIDTLPRDFASGGIYFSAHLSGTVDATGWLFYQGVAETSGLITPRPVADRRLLTKGMRTLPQSGTIRVSAESRFPDGNTLGTPGQSIRLMVAVYDSNGTYLNRYTAATIVRSVGLAWVLNTGEIAAATILANNPAAVFYRAHIEIDDGAGSGGFDYNGRAQLRTMWAEDVTTLKAVEATASAVNTTALEVSADAAAVEADRILTAQYRDAAEDARDDTSAMATTVASDAAVATAGAAAAQQAAGVAVSVGQGFSNPNSGFDIYPGSAVGSLPTDWTNWNGSQTAYRVADGLGGWSMRLPAAAGANSGVQYQAPASQRRITPTGYYVMEAEVTLEAGTFAGAALYIPFLTAAGSNVQSGNENRLIFATSPDQSGSPPGAGVVGRRYLFTRLVQATAADAHHYIIYLMNHWTPAGSTAAANDITWHKAGIRPARSDEVKIGTALPALEASVSSNSQALQDFDTSFASLENTVQAQGVTVSEHTTAITEVEGDLANMAGMWALAIDVNGRVVGRIKLDGTAQLSAFTVTTDIFKVENPSGGAGMTWTTDANDRPTLTVDDGAGSTVEIGWCP